MLVAKSEREGEVQRGLSKIDRYGWRVLDSKGSFAEIGKHLLLIDPEYQRTARNEKLITLARDWSWVAAGAIIVAKRSNGDHYVIDGQNRVLAARRRSDITTLPCMVFSVAEISEEAGGFLRANCNRKPISSADKFRAQIIVGDESAILVHNLIEQTGREVRSGSAGPTSVTCVGALVELAKSNREELVRLWPLITEISEGNPLHERVVRGLVYIERRLGDDSLTKSEWRKRVIKAGSLELQEAANEASAFYKSGGARVWALGMVNRLNRGCRNHIKLIGDDQS